MEKNKNTEIRRESSVGSAGLHIRQREDGEQSRTIAGYAVLFNEPSEVLYETETEQVREIIAPEAVDDALLERSDIKFTMFHDNSLILARSNKGEGTLRCTRDEKGVAFEFDAPNTVDGDKAIELVSRGDISGCSFAFVTRYWDKDCVEVRKEGVKDGKNQTVCVVRAISSLRDMTITPDPAYTATSVAVRELGEAIVGFTDKPEDNEKMRGQIREMRSAASRKMYH